MKQKRKIWSRLLAAAVVLTLSIAPSLSSATVYADEKTEDIVSQTQEDQQETEEPANSHFLRPAGPHFPASQGHIKRPVLEIGRAERGLRPANQYRALSQKAMLSQSVR